MKINTSFYAIYKNPNNNLKQPVKKSALSFKSRDLMCLPEADVLKKVRESIVPENFLGQGTEAEVYKIKNSDYCVRIPYLANTINKFNFSKELSQIDKINHIVAKLGFGVSIMKYFEGVIPKRYMSNNHDRYNLQKKIAEMPVESYSGLLHQIAEAIDNEMLFDYSGGNLIVDTQNQKLTAIDFYGMADNPKPVRPLCEMYQVLTCYGAEEKTGKKIFDKIVDAALEEFKPNNIPCMDAALFDFVDLVMRRNCDNKEHKKGNINDYIDRFFALKDNITKNVNELKQLKKTEIINKTMSKVLENKIAECEMLIKKIH